MSLPAVFLYCAEPGVLHPAVTLPQVSALETFQAAKTNAPSVTVVIPVIVKDVPTMPPPTPTTSTLQPFVPTVGLKTCIVTVPDGAAFISILGLADQVPL